MWDTGATHSSISPAIVRTLGLKPVDSIIVHGVNSAQAADVVIASIGLFCLDRNVGMDYAVIIWSVQTRHVERI